MTNSYNNSKKRIKFKWNKSLVKYKKKTIQMLYLESKHKTIKKMTTLKLKLRQTQVILVHFHYTKYQAL